MTFNWRNLRSLRAHTDWRCATDEEVARAIREVPAHYACSIVATDSFDRANGGLGANWTTVTSLAAPQINTNAVRTNAVTSDSGAYYSASSWSPDQYSQCKIVTCNTNTDKSAGVICRAASGAQTFYRCMVEGPLGASATVNLRKCVAGTTTTITSGTVTVNSNDVLRLEVIGTSLRCLVNGVQVLTTQTDTAITSGSAGVIVFVDAGATSDAVLDTWEGGVFYQLPVKSLQAVKRASYW